MVNGVVGNGKPFRPMLAYSDTPDDLRRYEEHLPLLGSYKLDGIRGVALGGKMLSRSLKMIPSSYAQSLALPKYEGLDGELLAKPKALNSGETIYHNSFSVVMTDNCQEPLDWWVFDYAAEGQRYRPYQERLGNLHSIMNMAPHSDIHILEQRLLETPQDIAEMEKEALDQGYEGLIVRRINAPYKCNRSTWKEGYLMKVVRVLTSEAIVEGFEEMMGNENEAKVDARGFTTRSVHQANLRPRGMLGAFYVRDIGSGVCFKIGGGDGLDHALRTEIWRNQQQYEGKIIKYSYKPYGTKDLPRQPKFLGWRDPRDM